MADTRSDLSERLHAALDEVIKFFSDEGKRKDLGSALHDADAKHADEGTLQRITDDLKNMLAKLKSHS